MPVDNKQLLNTFLPAFKSLKRVYGSDLCKDETRRDIDEFETIQLYCKYLEDLPFEFNADKLNAIVVSIIKAPKFTNRPPSPRQLSDEVRKIYAGEENFSVTSPEKEAYLLLHSYYGGLWESANPYGFAGARRVWALGLEDSGLSTAELLNGVKLLIKTGGIGSRVPKLHDLITFTIMDIYGITSIQEIFNLITSKKKTSKYHGLIARIVKTVPGGTQSINTERGEMGFYNVFCKCIKEWHKSGPEAENTEQDIKKPVINLRDKKGTAILAEKLLNNEGKS